MGIADIRAQTKKSSPQEEDFSMAYILSISAFTNSASSLT